MSKQLTILIADNYPVIREALSFMLNHEQRFHVVAETGDGKELIDLARKHRPDVILLDVQLEGMSGIEAIPQIRHYSPNSKILGVSMHTQLVYVGRMMRAGANGYLTKNSRRDEMFKAIIEIYEGRQYICEEIRDLLAEEVINGKENITGINSLSNRELEIIGNIIKGSTSKEIAAILNISTKTVEVHRYNILKKLNLKNVAALVNYFNMYHLELEERLQIQQAAQNKDQEN